MSEEDLQPPEAAVKAGRRLSIVWAIPLVALVIGGWLVYRTLSEKGPEISITFETASGLEPGKTPVKYRDVVIGTVSKVSLNPQERTVRATAEMVGTAEPLLTDTARFWVVRPRIGIKDISGLGTLVSGAYVEIDPGAGGKPQRAFTALEEPSPITADTPGTNLVLTTGNLGSLSRGSPLYFKGIEVGEVLGYELVDDNSRVLVHAFVLAPYDKLVRRTTRFWNVSGMRFSVGTEGLKVETGTLQSLVLGGIEFDTPNLDSAAPPVAEGTRFVLFDSRESGQKTAYTETERFIMYFDSSVRGLSIGAPVEFRGIKIGSVLDVRLEFDPDAATFLVPVLAEIELDRVSVVDDGSGGSTLTADQRRKGFRLLVSRGLRARLKTGSFLTGQLVVDLDMSPDTQAKLVGRNSDYLEIPTLPAGLEEITNSVAELVDKLRKLPLDTISQKMLHTLDGADRLVNSGEIKTAVASLSQASQRLNDLLSRADTMVMPRATETLKQAEAAMAAAERALNSLDTVVSENSAFRYETQTAIQEIAAAARSIRQFTEFLQRDPSALLTGRSPK